MIAYTNSLVKTYPRGRVSTLDIKLFFRYYPDIMTHFSKLPFLKICLHVRILYASKAVERFEKKIEEDRCRDATPTLLLNAINSTNNSAFINLHQLLSNILSLLKTSYLSLRAPKGTKQFLYCQRLLRLLRHSIFSNDIFQQPVCI